MGRARRLLDLGLDEHSPHALVKRIRLTNAISYFGVVLLLASIPFDAATAPPWMLAEDSFGALLYACFPLLARARRYLMARVGLIAISNLIVFGNAILLGPESGAQLVLLAFMTMPFALFDFHERRWQVIGIAMSLGGFLLVESRCLAALQDHRPDFVPASYYPYSIVVTIAALLFTMFQVSRANRDAEEAVEHSHKAAHEAAKLAALGQMSSGIAHEVNNPLMAIVMRAGQLRGQATSGKLDPKRVAETATHIEKVAERIKRIVAALRAFSRAGEREPVQPENIAAVVLQTVELCQGRFRRGGVTLEAEPVAEDLIASCRAVEITQVLVNLLNNAFDAIVNTEEPWVKITAAARNGTIELAVVDSGPGIPEPLRSRLMDPFFTTKPVGQGTGLGLSISKGLAESNGGTLALDSTSPQTRFVLTLPRA